MIWMNGARYDGSWRDDLMHGNGAMIYSDGTRSQGSWRDGKRV
jgi:1-phosphatidylinositol-4-phosphate 5-kinase